MVWIKCNICGEEWTQNPDISKGVATFALNCPNGCLNQFSQEPYYLDGLDIQSSETSTRKQE